MVKRRKRKATQGMAGEAIYGLLQKMGGSQARSRLASLWEKWDEVMGENLAGLAVPIGSRGNVLIIGAENAMELQELHFWGDELKERANAFLGCAYFENVRVTLFKKGEERRAPDVLPEEKMFGEVRSAAVRPSGKFLSQMDRKSPVARCYARFAGKKL